MELRTHRQLSPKLCGAVTSLGKNVAEVTLTLTSEMAVDEQGLVHTEFVFGLADYAAMAAVNHPWVVLTGAASDGDPIRPRVDVEVTRDDEVVASFVMKCAVLDRHVLEETDE